MYACRGRVDVSESFSIYLLYDTKLSETLIISSPARWWWIDWQSNLYHHCYYYNKKCRREERTGIYTYMYIYVHASITRVISNFKR